MATHLTIENTDPQQSNSNAPPSYEEATSKTFQTCNAVDNVAGPCRINNSSIPGLPNQNCQFGNQPQHVNTNTLGQNTATVVPSQICLINNPMPQTHQFTNIPEDELKNENAVIYRYSVTNVSQANSPLLQPNACVSVQTTSPNLPVTFSEENAQQHLLTPCITSQPGRREIYSSKYVTNSVGWNMASEPDATAEYAKENRKYNQEKDEIKSSNCDCTDCINCCECILDCSAICLDCIECLTVCGVGSCECILDCCGVCLECFTLCSDD